MTSLRISARPLLPTLRHVPRACRPATIGARTFSTSFAKWAVVKDGPPVTQTNRAEHTLRRFWKTVNISSTPTDGFLIHLDHRALKTPFGAKLEIPKERRLLAALIANEWENQDEVLKQHALPVTSLASRAIDGLSEGPTRPAVIDALLKYLETDTILYPDDAPAPLVRLQKEHWDPLRAWLKEDFGVELQLAQGFGAVKQTDDNVEKLKKVVEAMDGWELAAFERAVYATKSFVIALALCRSRLTAHEAAQASHVEVSSQIERWGEVEDTHDVDYQDIRRALGSAACLLIKS
ncbi:ATP synthase mitochondrial F1 complex assembly factor 2 [Cryptococcus bacillisporus CA1873]|uniref:ATP synthase mitochondrial F1 complex assembly factor 2 n=1 Tax=Cryptococcus bacillisporus CA1873 TaxID=1296111 RepID=A0ABR5BF84_CRYGA|nr:ATP synthase mitochondrial F1 complex assembly factor 2 [Cryptococcus bacillisporus CA1873]|eukprot:KIR67815.1 ATP synthase mitochondrial F1 complex assembly factor 2 [Cryptococcus gattii CA1873]